MDETHNEGDHVNSETFFNYDSINDSLFIYKKSKVKGSIDIGDIIIDISIDGKVIGLEILNASELLKNLGLKNPKEILKNIKFVKLRATYKRDSIIIFYCIASKSKTISSSVAIPAQLK